ncbi:MAG: hypothetical protein MJ003_06215 [Paludibacteraceae bacterium]|nr:hypothetical protein [Paludibacteraceae bacterium]
MKKCICVIMLMSASVVMIPQSVVTDPTSMAQRAAIFLEEMEETVSQSLDIAENNQNTLGLLKLSQQTIENLKNVSEFIKASRQLVEITEAEIRIADKMEKYSAKIKDFDNLSTYEKLNIIKSIITLGNAGLERVKSGIAIAKNGATDAKMSDYERIQILSTIEKEVLAIESSIDKVYETSVSKKSTKGMVAVINDMCINAITFNF